MALNKITAGLRAIHHNSMQVAKVQLNIAPNETLHVSEALAAQLQAASTHFVEVGAEPVRAEPEPGVEEDVPAKPAKVAAKKSPAKKR